MVGIVLQRRVVDAFYLRSFFKPLRNLQCILRILLHADGHGALAAQGIAAEVVNASVSGDTTAGGRNRLAALLQRHQPTHVVLELGGNDALRGLPLTSTEANLVAMTRASRAVGARVVITGMQVPPNYGRRYAEDFAALFGRVAQAEGAALVPFLLAGVADVPDAADWFQSDRIHPNERAHPRILDNVWPVLRPLLG